MGLLIPPSSGYNGRRGDGGAVRSSSIATFTDGDEGMRHDPILAYEGQGYKFSGASDELLDIGHQRRVRAILMRWEMHNRRGLVLCWYQVGDRSFRDKTEFIDRRLRGEIDEKKKLPLVKVQLHANQPTPEKDLLELAAAVAKWLNGCD